MAADESASLFRYRFGTAEFDEARFELRIDAVPVEIQRKPLEVLALLLRHVDEVVTREELLDQVWEGRPTVEHVVANALAKLRTALGKENAARVLTQTRVGYRLVGPVERVAVGRHFTSALQLTAGLAVPGRDSFSLATLLGRSNNSEVWLARHRKTDDARVFKFGMDGMQLAALKREATLYRVLRETLGEAPGIARIIDWNFTAAPFWLECEYVGPNLLLWSQEHLAALPLQERIGIFLQIADAVSAAHSVGVLHKDLKPANILMSPAPSGWQARVTDFGSGRLTEPHKLAELGITQLGLTVTHGVGSDSSSATPLYLSPEVLAGHAATVRSDVYALGLILYQLVVGDFRKPLASGWERDVPDEMLREDIEKATDGDPALRLASVGQLTDRLRRAGQRREENLRMLAAQRSRQRRPWIVALLTTLSMALLVSAWSLYSERLARERAEHEKTQSDAANAFLTDLLHGADPLNPGGNANATIRDVLERATSKIDARFANDPLTQAQVDLSVAGAWYGLSEYVRATTLQQRAVALLTAARGPASLETIEAQYALARSLDMMRHHQEAAQVLDAADAAAGSRLRTNASLALLAHWTRGGNLLLQAQPARALPEFEAAERFRMQADPHSELWMVRTRTDTARCYTQLNRPEDTLRVLQDLMAPAFTAERTGIADWSMIHLQYSQALTKLERFDDAIQITRTTIAELQRVLGPGHYLLAVAWSNLSTHYQAKRDWKDARDAAGQSYRILLASLGADQQVTREALGEMWIIEYRSGNVRGSIAGLQAARDSLSQSAGPTSPLTQYFEFYLASALNDSGRSEEARTLAEQIDPDALASTSPEPGWRERVDRLRHAILANTHEIRKAAAG